MEPPVASGIRSRQCKFSRTCDIFAFPLLIFLLSTFSKHTSHSLIFLPTVPFNPFYAIVAVVLSRKHGQLGVEKGGSVGGALRSLGRGNHLEASRKGDPHGRVFDFFLCGGRSPMCQPPHGAGRARYQGQKILVPEILSVQVHRGSLKPGLLFRFTVVGTPLGLACCPFTL